MSFLSSHCQQPQAQPPTQTQTFSQQQHTIIAPRSFNRLTFSDDTVTKTSLSSAIDGELYFYRNIPSPLKHLFPSLIRFTQNPPSFTINRIHGLTLSTLLTTGKLQSNHITTAIKKLHSIHSFDTHPHTSVLYANHARKVDARFRKHHKSIYAHLGLTTSSHFDSLLKKLQSYESQRRAHPVAIIHGDPVFTNILLDSTSGALKFIDMRGAQGDCLTIAGDATYDLAKLFQSLLGYDFVLADLPLSPAVVNMLSSHLSVFWQTVNALYPHVSVCDIVTVCCGLVTSLIPLHDNVTHRCQFATMALILQNAIDHDDIRDAAFHLVHRIAHGLSTSTSGNV